MNNDRVIMCNRKRIPLGYHIKYLTRIFWDEVTRFNYIVYVDGFDNIDNVINMINICERKNGIRPYNIVIKDWDLFIEVLGEKGEVYLIGYRSAREWIKRERSDRMYIEFLGIICRPDEDWFERKRMKDSLENAMLKSRSNHKLVSIFSLNKRWLWGI